MAKNVALKITLEGVEQSIQNITQLEKAILKAKQALSTQGFGEDWDKFSIQIKNAESRLKDLNKRVEGQEIEQKIGNYAKLGSAITSSFAAAQTALALFGTESESITEAATKAQQTLTLALVGRELAEGAVVVKTVAADIATKAATASTNAQNAATKALYNTLAKNPYTALLVGVGLLISAVVLLTKRTDEAAKKQKELQKAVDEASGTEIAKLKELKDVLEDESSSRDLKKKKIDEAKAAYGPYLARLDEEKLITGELKLNYDELTQALIRKAKADAFSKEVATLAGEELKIRRALTEATNQQAQEQKNLNDLEKGAAQVTGGGTVPGGGGALQLTINQRQKLISVTGKVNQLEKDLSKNLKDQKLFIDEITKANQLNIDILGGETKALEKNTDAQKKYIAALQLRLDEQIAIIKSIEKLNEVDAEVSAEVVQRANKLLDDAKGLIDKRKAFFLSEDEALAKEINDILFAVVPTPEELKTIEDGYIQAFESIFVKLKDGSIKLLDEQGKATEFGLDNIKKLLLDNGIPQTIVDNLDKLTPQAEQALVEFYTRLGATAERLGAGFSLAGLDITFDPETIQSNLVGLIDETTKILNDPTILPGLKNTQIAQAVESLFAIPEKTLDDFGGNTEAAALKLLKYNEGVQAIKDSLIEFATAEANQKIKSKEVGDELQRVTEQIRKAREELGIFSTEVNGFAEGVGEGNKNLRLSFEDQNRFIDFLVGKLKAAPLALDGFLNDVSANYDKYVDRFGKAGLSTLLVRVAEGFEQLEGLTSEQLNDLLITLTNNAEQIRTEYGNDVAASFEDLAARIRKALASIPTESEIAWNQTLKTISEGIQQLQSTIGFLGQTLAEGYSSALDIAEMKYQSLNEAIVGDTKEANDKRIELEEQYQEQRKKLEKQAAKVSLGISLVQASANVAESITKALAVGVPGLSQVLAAANAAIGLVQVGIITNQLVALEKYQKGGMVKGMGGLVVGPSHEQGGVKFQGGGIELEGGEAVINRFSTVQYQGLLDQINQSGGGRPLMANNFDDSRIVEAIAKQRNEPIRAYVVEADITNKQNVARRLEQLAQY